MFALTTFCIGAVLAAQAFADSYGPGAPSCPAFTPTDLSSVKAPAVNGVCSDPTLVCRYITTYLGSSNACVTAASLCQKSTYIDPNSVAGPADANLNCPKTTHCVSGSTTNGYTGSFCVFDSYGRITTTTTP
ncbi:unnamed protein product, partial [Mesorhabditis spiculigera]